MNAFVDTNLLGKFLFPNKKDVEGRRLVRLVLNRYVVKHNIVTLIESARNRRFPDYKRQKLHQLMGQSPIVPSLSDWKRSHYLLMEWASRKGRIGKHVTRKMQMDCLIAAMALNRDYAVVTGDSDFRELKATRDGQRLNLLQINPTNR